ncbi:MAG: hypothetical protein QXS12_04065 [Candidatus Caldarchaeum sp.]
MSWNPLIVETLSWLLTPSKRGTYYKLAVYLAALESYVEYGGATPHTVSFKLGLNSLWSSDVKHWLNQLADKGLLQQHPGTQVYTPTELAFNTLDKITYSIVEKALNETRQHQLNLEHTLKQLKNQTTAPTPYTDTQNNKCRNTGWMSWLPPARRQSKD